MTSNIRRGAILLAVLFSIGAGAAEIKPRIDIAAGPAGQALKQFVAQTGLQLLFDFNAVNRLTTQPVSGQLDAAEALKRMLTGTGLKFEFVNERTVTVTLPGADKRPPVSGRSGQAPQATELMLAQAPVETVQDAKKKEAQEKAAAEDDDTAEVTVTGSRLRSPLGEQIQPVLTITSEDIQSYGVSSLNEVFRYIPQISSYTNGQLIQATNNFSTAFANLTSARITATLRGAPAGGTLLLVDGRRAPKTGQETGADGYDLSGIPIAAIERIEVLLNGASAIYGADALGGVINVILKKGYRGTEARVNYENTFDTDVAVKSVSLSHGFAAGKLRGMITGAWEDSNEMMWADRPFLLTFDRRPFGGSDSRGGTVISGVGSIRSVSGNLPGLTTNRVAIPAGSTGVNVTAQQYANAGPVPGGQDTAEFAQYATPYERKSVVGNLDYEFNSHFIAFTEARWSDSVTIAKRPPVYAFDIRVPAGAPGNPFGVPVLVQKYFYDLEIPMMESFAKNQAYTLGAHGAIAGTWRYETSANHTRARPTLGGNAFGGNPTINPTRAAAAFASATPPILLYDSTSVDSPNPAGTFEALLSPPDNLELSDARTYSAQADGSLFRLPAGDVQVAIGTEYRDESVEFPRQSLTSTNPDGRDRNTSGYFVEMRVPLVSDAQGWPLVNRLEAQVAVRHDRYSDFPEATNPTYGMLYRPFRWLTLRGTYSEGYKVPTLSQLYQGLTFGAVGFAAGEQTDPFRGDTLVEAPDPEDPFAMPTSQTGNPNLTPEHSRSASIGLVLEVPAISGLSFSMNFYDTRYVDRVGGLSFQDRLLLMPESMIRGDNLPGDLPGWLGPIIEMDSSPINIAAETIRGYELGARFNHATAWAEFTATLNANRTTRREIRSAPDLPPTIQSTARSLPMQASGSLFMTRGAWDTGVLFSYRDEFAASTLATTAVFPTAIRWDWQGSYDFGHEGPVGGGWWGAMLQDTRLALTIFNVLNVDPPMHPVTTLPDNTIVDSRLRRYAISLTRRF